jgi:hypothetical protein
MATERLGLIRTTVENQRVLDVSLSKLQSAVADFEIRVRLQIGPSEVGVSVLENGPDSAGVRASCLDLYIHTSHASFPDQSARYTGLARHSILHAKVIRNDITRLLQRPARPILLVLSGRQMPA